MSLRAGARRRGSAELCDVYYNNDSKAELLCVHQTSALRSVVLRNPRPVLPGSEPCRTKHRKPRRPVPGRKQGAAPSDIHAHPKQHKLAAVESGRPRAPIPATVGQECFTVRQTQRLGLSVRSNARTPTSPWESGQTAALRASSRAPRRARRSLAPPRPDIWREASLSSPPRPDI